MAEEARSGRSPSKWQVRLSVVLLLGLAVRLPGLAEPLFEGAAGKQTHTAMVARNLQRGRASWLRPMVDDVGRPGYFVKELPLVAGLAAVVHGFTGAPLGAVGRSIGAVAWLIGAILLFSLVRRDRSPRVAALAALWFVLAPAAIAYSRSFMTDPSMVTACLGALLLASAWRDHPSSGRAAATGAAASLALLLKPHAIFWLVPALATAIAGRSDLRAGEAPPDTGVSPTPRDHVLLVACLAGGLGVAGLWYAHAASIHRSYPVPGAMVTAGWVDAALWRSPDLYLRIARQILDIVFTPAGWALALAAVWPGRAGFGRTERALLAWGAGVILQSVVLGTRMFDDAARGTEYYQLPAVATAALLVARGADRIAAFAARGVTGARDAIAPVLLLVAGALAWRETRRIETPPEAYASLPAQCERVRALTHPDDALLVLSDRAGTVLWTCDRRGTTLTPATAMGTAAASTRFAAAPDALWRTLESADHVFLPFPDLAPASLREFLDREWQRDPGEEILLYERRGARPAATP